MQAGTYTAIAKRTSLGFAESTHNEQIGIAFEITTPGPDQGRVIVWRSTFTPDTTARAIESLRNCGWTGDDLSVFCAAEDVSQLLPDEVEIVVEPKEYNGKTMLSVRWVNRIGSGKIFKLDMDAKDAKAFAARMKGACKAIAPKASAPKSNGKPRTREPGEDFEDDMPPGY